MKYVRHHLLQIILWPNADGTYRTILNSKAKLRQLGVYDDYRMTIRITQSAHVAMHNRYEKRGVIASNTTRAKLSKRHKGKTFTYEHKKNLSISQKGRIISEHAKMMMKQNHYDCTGKNNSMYGNHSKCYNNGVTTIRSYICPEGFVPGRLPNKKRKNI